MEKEKIENAIKAVGRPEITFKEKLVRCIQRVLIEKSYDEAIVFAEQYFLSTDVNVELVRTLVVVCRRYRLSPIAATQVLDILSNREAGKE
jgi:hypothetical protein